MNIDKIVKKHHAIYRKLEKKNKLTRSETDQLKRYHILRGAGIFSNIKHAITWRYDLSPSDKKQLETYGDQTIIKIQIVRQPLAWLSKKAADILSGNTVDDMIKNLGYDRMYHLFLYIFLQDGTCILTERNETVRLYKTDPVYLDGAETLDINDTNNVTLKDFFQKGVDSMDKSQFWIYRPESTNCQDYVMTLLDANGLSTPDIKTFVLQDAKALLSKAGFGKKIFQFGSDIAAKARFLVGKGMKTKRHIK